MVYYSLLNIGNWEVAMKNAIVGQSGGPTSAINATLRGVVQGFVKRGGTVFGMHNGIQGLLDEDIVNLEYLKGEALTLLSKTPAAHLGSCRMRLPDDLSQPVYNKIFSIFEKYNIGYVYYIGGNDSMDTVDKLSRYAKINSVDVCIIGVPKTIDNDLVLTDHTPGYGSCAKYVAGTVCELDLDVSVYTKPSVTILEVMGREAGWIGMAAALPKYLLGRGSDLVYLPEGGFSCDKFLSDVEKLLSRQNSLLVTVSEGVPAYERVGDMDVFGHAVSLSGCGVYLSKMVKERLKCKSRAVELSLTQRCAGHLTSRTDIEESVRLGEFASSLVGAEFNGSMVAMVRKAGDVYGVDFTCVPASEVANRVKKVPVDFINDEQNFVTQRCIDYVSPLIVGEIDLEYVMGMPKYLR